MWKFLFLTCLMHITIGVKIRCDFNTDRWSDYEEEVYRCSLRNEEIFDGTRITIDSMEGEHQGNCKNDDVQGVYISDINSVKFFPRNIESVFKNLNYINIRSCQLQNIKQSDLKTFPQLKYLSLTSNNIDTINEDLFEFNPYLEYINLYKNDISHIEPNAFDHLNNLRRLDISENRCNNKFNDASSRGEVLNVIKKIMIGGCSSSFILITRNYMEIKNLMEQVKELQERLGASEKLNGELNGNVLNLINMMKETRGKNV